MAEAILRQAGETADEQIDLARTALAFAACMRPQAGEARFADHLQTLVDEVRHEASGKLSGLAEKAEALRAVLVERHGYRGDRETYDDLDNADLSCVIERRRGLPVALSILWLHAGRGQGWAIAGLNFPGHFIVRLQTGGERLILDPFNDGQLLDTNDLRALLKSFAGERAELDMAHYQPLPNRAILLRLQNNIKIRLLNANAHDKALPVIERMLMVAPKDVALWREAGLVHRQLENLRAAIACLETAYGLAEASAARQRIAAEIAALKGKLN